MVKQWSSPFYPTGLEFPPRARGIGTLLLTGVLTDLVVPSTVTETHDRDLDVRVLKDATVTGDENLQTAATLLMARTALVTSVAEAWPEIARA